MQKVPSVAYQACIIAIYGIWDMVQDTCLWGTNCWLLTIKINYHQNTELREWIAFRVMIVWLLVCLVVSINCVVLYVINCHKIDICT